MAIDREVLELEKKFWTQGADFYRENIDNDCLVVFGAMAGVMSREEVAATVKDNERFSEPEIEEKGVLEMGPDALLFAYKAKAKRPDGKPYEAVVTSGYIRRAGRWKLAYHQQAPVQEAWPAQPRPR